MNNLLQEFPGLSFISWEINDHTYSYKNLQTKVSLVPIKPAENKARLQEMSSFVSTEFDCSLWQNIFLEKAKEEFTKQQQNVKQKTLKPKQQDQEISTIKNQLIKTKASIVVPQLITKGKQFSTLVTQEFPHYNECIRLSVHCDKEEVDLSHKIPISLIYGHFGTPWHNAIVVDQDECHLFKDVFKKSSFSNKQVVNFDMLTKQNKIISLKYIKNQEHRNES